jgi:hypothetical protein
LLRSRSIASLFFLKNLPVFFLEKRTGPPGRETGSPRQMICAESADFAERDATADGVAAAAAFHPVHCDRPGPACSWAQRCPASHKSPAEFAEFIDAEMKRWTELGAKADISVE